MSPMSIAGRGLETGSWRGPCVLSDWLLPFPNSYMTVILKDPTIEKYIKEKMKAFSALQRGNHGNS